MNNKRIKIAPSILASDFLRLGEEIDSAIAAGAELIHFDVMDGEFVPNISIGLPVLESVVRRFKGKALIDAHLMIAKPWRYAKRFAEAGADVVSVHAETGGKSEIADTLDEIRSGGAVAGLALKPATDADAVIPFLDKLGTIMVMTVEPGFGGQKFMEAQLPKIRTLRRMIDDAGIDCEIEVDGGITPETAKMCIDAGAAILVAGNSVFSTENRAEMITMLKSGK